MKQIRDGVLMNNYFPALESGLVPGSSDDFSQSSG